MTTTLRPLPQPTDVTRPFWEAAATHRLVIQSCQNCGCKQFYPRAFCTACLGESLRWIECSGRGRIYTYTINYRGGNAYMRDKTPYAVAVIELDEGVRMLANIVESNLADIAIGKPVQVRFEQVSDELTLPQFMLTPGGTP